MRLDVDSSTISAAAISPFERPRAISSSTSRSRGVSASRLRARPSSGVGWRAMRSITRRVTDGDSSDSPAAIVCIASISSSGRVRLSRKPDAPARRPPKT